MKEFHVQPATNLSVLSIDSQKVDREIPILSIFIG